MLYNQKIMRIPATVVSVITLLALFPYSTEALGHSCEVSPFSKRIQAGGEAVFNVKLSGADGSFGLEIGNLPKNVTGGFQNTQSGNNAELVLRTTSATLPQSASVVVLYAVGQETVVCQLNLVIESKPVAKRSSISRTSAGSSVVTGPLVKKIGSNAVSINQLGSNAQRPQTVFTKNLKFGQWDREVSSLQDFLRTGGYFPSYQRSTGYFGPLTVGALKKFQTEQGLPPSGILDGPTLLKIKTGG